MVGAVGGRERARRRILEDDGTPIAANRATREAEPQMWRGRRTPPSWSSATNARLLAGARPLLAQAAHEGISLAVRPAHTMWDGDTVFSLATGEVEPHAVRSRRWRSDAVAEAIRRGVRAATGVLGGVPAASEGEAR